MLTFKDVDGKTLDMKALLKGKKGLLVNFWYYDCGYCQIEFPHLKKIYDEYKSQGLEVLIVNSGTDSLPVIRQLLATRKLTMPTAVNGASAVEQYGVVAFPTTYLIDAKGEIVHCMQGFRESEIEKLPSIIKALKL